MEDLLGGCGFLFWKSLLPFITRLQANYTRFCALSINSDSFVTLLVCVYLPTNYGDLQSNELYMETLAELKGFTDSVSFVLAGDFNGDFGRASSFRSLLQSFLDDLNLCSADLSFSHSIDFTYERDDGLVRSWPDHVLTLVHHSDRIHDVSCIHSANNFSDHSPLSFCSKIAPIAPVSRGSLPSSQCSRDVICWSEID